MSVRTTADENIAEAKDHVQGAIAGLAEVVVSKCYGTDEYSADYINKLTLALIELIKIRDSIG